MTPQPRAGDADPNAPVKREDWARWCTQITEASAGRKLTLTYVDAALGEVRVAEDQPFLGIEHDGLGSVVTLTVRYGGEVVPLRYVIGKPREVSQHQDAASSTDEVTIVDSTGRRTVIDLT